MNQEPFVRMAISGVRNALNWTERLRRTEYDSALLDFRHHAHEAIHALQEWAKANDITVRESMRT